MIRTTQGTPRYALRPSTICTPRMQTRLLSFPVPHPTSTMNLVAAARSIFYAQQNTLHALGISYMQAHVIRLRFVVCTSHAAAHDTRCSFFSCSPVPRGLCVIQVGRQMLYQHSITACCCYTCHVRVSTRTAACNNKPARRKADLADRQSNEEQVSKVQTNHIHSLVRYTKRPDSLTREKRATTIAIRIPKLLSYATKHLSTRHSKN